MGEPCVARCEGCKNCPADCNPCACDKCKDGCSCPCCPDEPCLARCAGCKNCPLNCDPCLCPKCKNGCDCPCCATECAARCEGCKNCPGLQPLLLQKMQKRMHLSV